MFGIHKSSEIKTNSIIFFEIPGCEQISWHCTLKQKDFPTYSKKWDEKINSTLRKIETKIRRDYFQILEQ